MVLALLFFGSVPQGGTNHCTSVASMDRHCHASSIANKHQIKCSFVLFTKHKHHHNYHQSCHASPQTSQEEKHTNTSNGREPPDRVMMMTMMMMDDYEPLAFSLLAALLAFGLLNNVLKRRKYRCLSPFWSLVFCSLGLWFIE